MGASRCDEEEQEMMRQQGHLTALFSHTFIRAGVREDIGRGMEMRRLLAAVTLSSLSLWPQGKGKCTLRYALLTQHRLRERVGVLLDALRVCGSPASSSLAKQTTLQKSGKPSLPGA